MPGDLLSRPRTTDDEYGWQKRKFSPLAYYGKETVQNGLIAIKPTEIKDGDQDQVSQSSSLRLFFGESPIMVSRIGCDPGTDHGCWAPDSDFQVK